MEPYHFAWLSIHPERSEEWLKQKLAEGFDVHHLDGNHSNDDSRNLVLIECDDHLRLHGVSLKSRLHAHKIKMVEKRREMGHGMYELRQEGLRWRGTSA